MGVSPEKLGSEASVCPLDILWRTLASVRRSVVQKSDWRFGQGTGAD